MKKYAMMVLGCKVNDYEANYVRERLNNYYSEVSFKEYADIYIIFTCCVTNTAEAKTRKFINDAYRRNKDAYIVAVGCLSQIKPDSEIFNKCNLVIGSDQKDQIIDNILSLNNKNLVNKEISFDFEELNINSYQNKSRGFLKIQDGCNQFCSYCIIPYSRGRERSGNHLNIISQANILSKTVKEIVLTGIHTGRYNDGEYDLYHLLKSLIEIDDLKTIRLSSIEITEISDEIIELFVNNPKLAKHLHIPVQSPNDITLKNMNRPYTLEYYKNRIDYIRSKIKGVSISTDLIVGFPNETDDMFNDVLNELKIINFSFIHVFPYSRKTNTVADKMNNHLDPKVIKERVRKVIDLNTKLSQDFKKSLINKEVEVLIEKVKDGYSYGYSKEYVYIKINQELIVGNIYKAIVKMVNDDEVIAYVTE